MGEGEEREKMGERGSGTRTRGIGGTETGRDGIRAERGGCLARGKCKNAGIGVGAHLELLEVDGAVAVLVLELELARHELLVPRRVRGEDVKVVEQLAHLSLPVWVGRIASSVSVDG